MGLLSAGQAALDPEISLVAAVHLKGDMFMLDETNPGSTTATPKSPRNCYNFEYNSRLQVISIVQEIMMGSVAKVNHGAAPVSVKDSQGAAPAVPVDAEIAKIQVIHGRVTRKLFRLAPLFTVIITSFSVFAFWYIHHDLDYFSLVAGTAATFSFLITQRLVDAFPQTLRTLWRRNVIAPRSSGREPELDGFHKDFIDFLHDTQALVDSWAGVALGVTGALLTLWIDWMFNPSRLQQLFRNLFGDPATGVTGGILTLIYLCLGYVAGFILWKIVAIAWSMRRIGFAFDIRVQVNHPDGCGGLKPVGDLCFLIASTITPFLVVIGAWLTLLNLTDVSQYKFASQGGAGYLVSTVQILILPLVFFSLFGFILPITGFHEAMQRASSHLQKDLDELSERINEINITLFQQAESLSPEAGEKIEKQLDLLKRVYDRNSHIPTWPINPGHVGGMISSQFIPMLGLVSSVVGVLKSIIQ